MTPLETVRLFAALGRVSFVGDCDFSLGGRGVDQVEVMAGLANASAVADHSPYVLVTCVDYAGVDLFVFLKIGDQVLHVESVKPY